jgi:lysylphosphatidylglycerol synthetase-like protein (DUF2156 family)
MKNKESKSVVRRDGTIGPTTYERLKEAADSGKLWSCVWCYMGFAAVIIAILICIDVTFIVIKHNISLGIVLATAIFIANSLVTLMFAYIALRLSHRVEKDFGDIARKISLYIILILTYLAKGEGLASFIKKILI